MAPLKLYSFAIALLAMATCNAALSLPANPNTRAENATGPVFLGSVDNKIFFMENSTRRTWQEAKGYCHDTGMELAKITSVAQANFVLNSAASETPYHYFWINARNGQKQEHFVWDDDQVIHELEGIPFSYHAGIQVCVQFHTTKGENQGRFQALACSYPRNTLCEVNNVCRQKQIAEKEVENQQISNIAADYGN